MFGEGLSGAILLRFVSLIFLSGFLVFFVYLFMLF